MKFMKKLVVVCLISSMVMSQAVSAEEATATTAAQPEAPSNWAAWDVQMLSVYGIGNAQTFTGYKEVVSLEQFKVLHDGLLTSFEVSDELDEDLSELTRGDVVREFYDIMNEALMLSENEVITVEEVIKYFVDEKLMNGRTNGDYALDSSISNEEMIVFTKRVFDHMTYKLDKDITGTFWTVSDENNTVYLLGSVHATDGSVYPLNDEIMAGFADSAAIAVEANTLVLSPEDVAYIQQLMMLEEGVTIDQVISEEVYTKYETKAIELGLTADVYNKLKPWYASIVLSNAFLASNNLSGSLGIDTYFQYLAYGSKPIMEIEGMKYQFDMLNGFNEEQAESMLAESLSEDEASSELLELIMTNWKSGNIEELNEGLFAEEAVTESEKEVAEAIWGTRNKHMSEYIVELLEADTDDNYFVIVGAGHYLNDDGIVAELEALGYVVEQSK